MKAIVSTSIFRELFSGAVVPTLAQEIAHGMFELGVCQESEKPGLSRIMRFSSSKPLWKLLSSSEPKFPSPYSRDQNSTFVNLKWDKIYVKSLPWISTNIIDIAIYCN